MEDYIIPPTEEELLKYSGDDEVVSSIDLKKVLKEKYKDVSFWKTHIPSLNAMIGGFMGGELTVVSGKTGNGKTLYCQSLTKAFADNKDNSLWFTYEVQSLQFLNQFGDNLPHFYMPKILKSKSLEWIYTRVKEAKIKFDIKFIFIDHLHFLVDIITRSNPSLEIGRVMRTLKMWSLEFNIAMFLVSHMMKVKSEVEPESGDCRDCLPLDQLIYLSNGKRIAVRDLRAGDKVLSYRNIKTLQYDIVANIWDSGLKDIYKITTETGNTIEASDGHKFYATTYKKSNQFGSNQGCGIQGWTKLKDLVIGQKILTVRKYLATNNSYIITPTQAIVLGWLIGDGHITKKYNSEITINTEEECILLKKIANKAWDLNCKYVPYKNKKAFRFYLTTGRKRGNNKLIIFLRKIKYNAVGDKKYIPKEILEDNDFTIMSFLQGLFHADGSINLAGKNKSEAIISLNTISNKLAQDIKFSLLRLGIVCRLNKQKTNKSGFKASTEYTNIISIYGQNIKEYMHYIGFLSNKQDRAMRLLENWKPKCNIRSGNLYFEKIKNIEYIGKKETYDISVRGYHSSLVNNSFCVENFITHNSSFIEQEADNVFYVWRIANLENGAMLKITKNRGMGVWNKKIKLIKRGNYLMELSSVPDINNLSDESDMDLDSFGKEE